MKPKFPSHQPVDSNRSLDVFTKTFTLSVGLAVVGILTQSAQAAAPEWNTAVDGAWTDGTKWSTGLAPIAGDTVTFNVAGQNGPETIYMDGDHAAATLTFANTSTTTLLGGISGAPANSTLVLAATGTITSAVGAGAVTLGDTAAVPAAPVLLSMAAGASIINNSGTPLTIANRFTGAGALNTAGGTITFTGAGTEDISRSSGAGLKIGNGAGGGGTVNINGFFDANFATDPTILNGAILNWNATGSVGNTAGVGNTISVGGNAGTVNTSGTLNVTGGVFTAVVGAADNTRAFNIGGTQQISGTSTANGQVSISGGSLVVSTNSAILLGSGYRDSVSGSGNGTLTIGGTAALFDTGSTTGLFRLGNKSAAVGTGTINLNTGGTLATNRSITRGAGAGATATFNFDGGTLKANGPALNLTGLSAVNVKAGGAVIDTNSSNVTIANGFLNGTGGGADGGLAKLNPGTLTLTGTSTYTGATSLTDGTLEIGGAGSINSTSGITINGANAKFLQTSSVAGTQAIALTQGTLDGTGTAGAVTVANGTDKIVANGNGTSARLTVGSLSFGGLATVNIIDSAATPTARIAVTGALVTTPVNGKVTINGSGSWSNGLNNLISYASLTGSLASFELGTIDGLTSRQSLGSLSLVANNLALTIIGDSPKWTGRDSTEWVIGATGALSNWKLVTGGGATDYIQGDSVLFDDSATIAVTPGLVTLSTADVSPALTAFDNSSISYSVAGAFGIAGTGSLVKSGTAKTTLATTNTYTGTTSVNAGTLSLQNTSALGASAGATVASGAVLELQGNVAIGPVPLTLNGAGLTASPAGALRNVSDTNSYAGVVTLGSNATIQSDAGSLALTNSIGGSGTLTVTGAGSVVLTGSNSYTGGTIVNNGILSINLDAALGAVSGAPDPVNVTLNGGTLLSAPTTLNANRGITLGSGGGVLTAIGGTVNVAGKITGSGNLTITNSGSTDRIALQNTTNDFTGLVSITAGILNVNDGGGALGNINNGITFTGSSTLQKSTTGNVTIVSTRTTTINPGVTATLDVGNAGGGLTMNGPITGDGALTKIGAGTATLVGTNTYTGATTVTGGTLSITQPVLSDTAAVEIAVSGATLNLPHGTTDQVASLTIGTLQPNGTYGSLTSTATFKIAQITGTGILQVGPPVAAGYSSWAASFPFTVGVNDGPDQDADGDGIKNLLEYVFGGIPVGPGSNDPSILPVQTLTATDLKLTFKRSDLSETDAVVKVQWSADLATWNDFATIGALSALPAVTVTEDSPTAELDTVEVLIPRTNAVGGKLFGRVIATKP